MWWRDLHIPGVRAERFPEESQQNPAQNWAVCDLKPGLWCFQRSKASPRVGTQRQGQNNPLKGQCWVEKGSSPSEITRGCYRVCLVVCLQIQIIINKNKIIIHNNNNKYIYLENDCSQPKFMMGSKAARTPWHCNPCSEHSWAVTSLPAGAGHGPAPPSHPWASRAELTLPSALIQEGNPLLPAPPDPFTASALLNLLQPAQQ